MTLADQLRRPRLSGWHLVTQRDVDAFAENTGDRQWIHVDPERAARGPFGRPVAHGLYTLSLAPALLAQAWPLERFDAVVNYGFDRVRLPAPVPVGSEVRMTVTMRDARAVPGGAHVRLELVFERREAAKPVCVALWVLRLYGAEAHSLPSGVTSAMAAVADV